MFELETIRLDVSGPMARVMPNRPEVLNAGEARWVRDRDAVGDFEESVLVSQSGWPSLRGRGKTRTPVIGLYESRRSSHGDQATLMIPWTWSTPRGSNPAGVTTEVSRVSEISRPLRARRARPQKTAE